MFLGGAGEKTNLGLILQKGVEIVLINGKVKAWHLNLTNGGENLFNSRKIKGDEKVRIDLVTLVKEPANSGGSRGEIRLPVGVTQAKPTLFKCGLNWGWWVDVALDLAVGDVDILETYTPP